MEQDEGFTYLDLGLTLTLLIIIVFCAVIYVDRSASGGSSEDGLLGVTISSPRPAPLNDFQRGDTVKIGNTRCLVYSLNPEEKSLGDRLGYLIYGSEIVIIGEVRSINRNWYWPAKVIRANLVLEGQDVWIHDESILTKIER